MIHSYVFFIFVCEYSYKKHNYYRFLSTWRVDVLSTTRRRIHHRHHTKNSVSAFYQGSELL